MIAIEADFNHLDGDGHLLLTDLTIHTATPFVEIAKSAERILFVDGVEVVEGRIIADERRGWVGEADWETQDILRAYPPDRPVLTSVG